MHNVVICKRIKKTHQNATLCVAEWPKSARQVVLASWSVCGGVQSLCCQYPLINNLVQWGPLGMQYLNVVICKRIKNSSKRYTVRGRMAKVSETGSSSVMIGVWWCPCNTCFPWVKVGVPMWKSNTSLVLRCSDAQCAKKIAIFCSKRIEVRAPLLPGKKWSYVMINFKASFKKIL